MRAAACLLGALLGALACPAAFADAAADRGREIAAEADRRGRGYGDSSARLTMILRNAAGRESRRQIRSRSLEVSGDGDKTLIVFDEPKDVAGTALLTFAHKAGDDDRWLWLPALKRVKRIAGSSKSGPFMGSEFAYEDLGSQEPEKYRHRWLRDEPCGALACFVVERVPVDPESGYTRQVAWLDRAEYRLQKVEFHDRKATLLKTLEAKEYAKHAGRWWRPARMDMVNHQTGKSTTLLLADYRFGNGFTARDFDQNSLQSAR